MQTEIAERIKKIQQHLTHNKIDLAILSQNADIYYYTGSIQPLYVLVPASGEPLMLARKAIQRILDEAPHFELVTFNNTKDLAEIVRRHGWTSFGRIGMVLDAIPYASAVRLQRLFEKSELVDISWDVRTARMIKSKTEVEIQARAGQIMARIPEIICDGFRPGMTELQLSAVIEKYFRLNGHGAIVRCRWKEMEMGGFGVCAGGQNTLSNTKFDSVCVGHGLSAAIPCGAGCDPIGKGTPVVIDYAFVLDGYHVDQTRMFCWGQPSKKITDAYQAMVKIEQTIIDLLTPGRDWEEVYSAAVKLAAELGYSNEFMGLGTEKVKFVGHGVGLELDEPPFLAPKMKDSLAEGMVLAVEPKVALQGIGVVGIEDTLLIGAAGAKHLTTCPNDLIIYE